MGIQVQGTYGFIAEVDGTAFRAVRIRQRPAEYGQYGSYRMAQVSGTIAGSVALQSDLYQFRWTDASRLAVVTRVSFSVSVVVAFSPAALMDLALVVARAWTNDGSGGTAATITGNNAKLRTLMGTTLSGSMRIASTAALNVGAKTLDTQGISSVTFGLGSGILTVSVSGIVQPKVALLDGDDFPMVLAFQEGWVVQNTIGFPPVGSWGLGVAHSWSEVVAY